MVSVAATSARAGEQPASTQRRQTSSHIAFTVSPFPIDGHSHWPVSCDAFPEHRQQIRDDCAYNRNNVKIVALFTGLEAGPWGATHHAMEDIALMRAIPGMTVLVPSDFPEVAEAVRASASIEGPVYIRMAGFAADMSPIEARREPFSPGKAATLREGTDLAIFATGTAVRTCLQVAELLAKDAISAGVLNVSTIKPIDRGAIETAAREVGLLLTVEEHSIVGGLGSAVAEVIAELGTGRLRRVGIPDRFCTEVAPYSELLAICGLDAAGVESAARDLLRKA